MSVIKRDGLVSFFIALSAASGVHLLICQYTDDMDVLGILFFLVVLPVFFGVYCLVFFGLAKWGECKKDPIREMTQKLRSASDSVKPLVDMLLFSDQLDIRCAVKGDPNGIEGEEARRVAIDFFAKLAMHKTNGAALAKYIEMFLRMYEGRILVKHPVPCEGFDIHLKDGTIYNGDLIGEK